MNTPSTDGDPIPTGIVVERDDRSLNLSWNSGDPTKIGWAELRLACPCAQCRGEDMSHGPDRERILSMPEETELTDVVLMGHYALQPVWASGHATGIFTWELLRTLG